MPSEIYVVVPEDYPYKFGKYESGPQVLTRDFGVNFEFICNRGGKLDGVRISDGDIHRVEFNNDGEELIFLLKSSFTLLNTDVVKRYIETKRWKYEESNRSPSRRRR